MDFANYISKDSFSWFSAEGYGLLNIVPCNIGLNIIILYLIENLTHSIAITNFTLVFCIYFLPFLFMLLACKELKATPLISFIVAFFYVCNPFISYYLICINQWNVFSVAVIPLFFWLILRFYGQYLKLFFFFGLASAVFNFAYTNQPLLVIDHISMLVSTVFISLYIEKKFKLSKILLNYSVVFISFILFNLWWILSFLNNDGLSSATKIYTVSFARGWLGQMHGPILAKTFFLTSMIGDTISYDFFTAWYGSLIGRLVTLVPFVFVAFFVLLSKTTKTKNMLTLCLFGFLLADLFLLKGTLGVFGFVFALMFKFIPYFFIFKTPLEKFGIMFVFYFSVLLVFVFIGLKGSKFYRRSIFTFLIYLFFCSFPLLAGYILPDARIGDYGFSSRKYLDKDEYRSARNSINSENSLYRVLSLPTGGNYQLCLPNYNGKKYTGLDPVLKNIKKAYLAQQHDTFLFKHVSEPNFIKLLGIFNVGKILVNEDVQPWFGKVEKETNKELNKVFSNLMPKEKWGNVSLYSNTDYFLPRIYVAGSDESD